MKELMKTNVYDVGESVLIVGSCLPDMEPDGFAQLRAEADHVFELCLEQTHINMAITKISAMLYTGKIRTLRFATVDRSPHCVQMHYIQNELRRMMDLSAVTTGKPRAMAPAPQATMTSSRGLKALLWRPSQPSRHRC